MNAQPANTRNAHLDVVRVVAASLVFLGHYKPFGEEWLWIQNELHIGVNLFFMLSGYLMAQLYPRVFFEQGGGRRRFFIRRLGKLFWLPLLVGIVQLGIVPAASSLTHYWTLIVEGCFYLAYGFLLMRLPGWGVLMVGVASVLGFFLLVNDPAFWLVYSMPGRLFEFGLGVWLGRGNAPGEGAVRCWPKGITSSAKPLPFILWFLLGSLSTLLSAYLLFQFLPPNSGRLDSGLATPEGALANSLPVALLLAFGWLMLKPKRIPVPKILSLLARSSFAFYLMHVGPVGRALHYVCGHHPFLTFVLLWLISLVTHLYLEKPLLDRFYKVCHVT